MKKILATVLALCMLLSMTVIGVSADDATPTFEYTYEAVSEVGTYNVNLLDTVDVTVYGFEPTEAGVYEVTTTTDGVTMHQIGGSAFFQFYIGVAEENKLTFEVKESNIGNTYLYGVSGDVSTATISISLSDEEIEVDPEDLPYTEYVTTETLSNFTMPEGEVEYVDITESHTAVLGDDGYYHLDSADGEILYVDLVTDYVNIVEGATNGRVNAYLYNEDGSFKAKFNYSTCVLDYNAVADDGVYPMTSELIDIMKNSGATQGWYDIDSMGYLFVDMVIDEETGWMFNACYIPSADPEPSDPEPSDPESSDPAPSDPALGEYENPYMLYCDSTMALMVTVPAGTSAFVKADNADNTVVTGEATVAEGVFIQYGRQTFYTIEFTMNSFSDMFEVYNGSDSDTVVYLRLSSPVATNTGTYELGSTEKLPGAGTFGDEYVLTLNSGEAVSYVTEFAGGENMGFMHAFTADVDGTFTVTMTAFGTAPGWQYDISTGEGFHWNDDDPVVFEETVTVTAGERVVVSVASYDPANMWTLPEGTVEWSALFTETVADDPTEPGGGETPDDPEIDDSISTDDEPADDDIIDDGVTDDDVTDDDVVDEATGDEATGDEATDDEATDDEATGDEATDDEATDDEATGDEATPDEYEIGDVDGDGIVNIKDVTAIQKYLVDLVDVDDINISAADFNEDGTVNIKDATAIQKYLAGLPY